MADKGLEVLISADPRLLNKAIADAEKRITEFGRHADKSLGAIDKAADKAAASVGAIGAKGAASLGRIAEEAKKAGAGIEGVGKAAEQAKQHLSKLDVAAGAVFAGLSIGVGAALKSFSDFEGVLNQIGAVSGASAGDLAKLEAAAMALGAATRFSAKEAAEGMAELSKAGFTAAETAASIGGALALAAAGGIKVGVAAETTAGALRGFGLAAGDAGKVADLLATAANQSSVDVKDLAESFKYAAPAMAGTGQTIEQTTSLLAVLGNSMIKGSEAGTALRSMVVSLAEPNKDAAGVLSKLAITINDTSGKMLPLATIMGQLRDKTANWGETQRAAALASIFGRDALSAVMALVNTAPADLGRMNAAMKDSAGAAQDMADKMNRGLGPAFEQLKGSLDTLAIQMGKEFAPAATLVVSAATDATNAVVAMPEAFKAAGAGVTVAVTAFTGLALALRGLGFAFGTLRVAALAATATLGPALPVVLALSVALGVAAVASKSYADAADAEKRKTEDAHKARITAITGARSHVDALNALAAEHDKLIDKTNRTAAEDARLKQIQEKLTKGYPVLAEAIKLAGDKHWLTSKAVVAENGHKQQLIRTNIQLAESELKAAGAKLAAARIDAAEAEETQRRAKVQQQNMGFGQSRRGVTEDAFFTPTENAAVSRRASALDAAEKRLADARKHLNEARTAGSTGGGDDKFDPNPFAGGGSKGHKGDATRKAAQDALDRLAFKYGQLNKANETFKGGMAGEKEIAQAYVLELKLLGLDRVKEGGRLVAQLGQQIQALDVQMADAAGEKRFQEMQEAFKGLVGIYDRVTAAAIASVEAQRKAGEDLKASAKERAGLEDKLSVAKLEGVDRERAAIELAYRSEVQAADEVLAKETERVSALRGVSDERRAQLIEEAGAVRDLKVSLADLGKQAAADEITKRNTQAFRDMQGALTALAMDPSIERIANFVRDLAGSKDKLAAVVDVLKSAGKASDEAGGGLGGAAQAAGVLAGHLDPISLAMAVLVDSSNRIANSWSVAADNAERMRDAARSADRKAAEASGDPGAVRDVEMADLWDNWGKTYNRERHALLDEMGVPGFMHDMQSPTSYQDRLAERLKPYERVFNLDKSAIEGKYNDRQKEIREANPLAPAEFGAGLYGAGSRDGGGKSGTRYGLVVGQGGMSEAEAAQADATRRRYEDALDRINAIDAESQRGEHDDRGNVIGLIGRRDLDVAKAKNEHQDRLNKLLADEQQIREDLQQLAKDEAKAIADIQAEGIAVRAKTETQSKMERIADVQAKAQAKRDDLNQQLADIATKKQAEDAAYADTTARIKNLADERIAKLNQERDAIMANVDALRIELGLQGDLTAELRNRENAARLASTAGASPSSSGGGSSSGSASVGTVRPNLNTDAASGGGGSLMWSGSSWEKFHDGGVVPGRPGVEVPIIAKAGETILPTHKPGYDISAWAASMRSPVPAGWFDGYRGAAGGGSNTVNLGGITINAAGGDLSNPMVIRQLTDVIDREMGRRIQQRGHRRI